MTDDAADFHAALPNTFAYITKKKPFIFEMGKKIPNSPSQKCPKQKGDHIGTFFFFASSDISYSWCKTVSAQTDNWQFIRRCWEVSSNLSGAVSALSFSVYILREKGSHKEQGTTMKKQILPTTSHGFRSRSMRGK